MKLPAFAAGLIFLCLGLLVAFGSWYAYRREVPREYYGARAPGRISQKLYLKSDNGDRHFVLRYTFSLPNGRQYESSASVRRGFWKRFRKGEAIEIDYDPTSPKRNSPIETPITPSVSNVLMFALGFAFSALGFLICLGSGQPSGSGVSDIPESA